MVKIKKNTLVQNIHLTVLIISLYIIIIHRFALRKLLSVCMYVCMKCVRFVTCLTDVALLYQQRLEFIIIANIHYLFL